MAHRQQSVSLYLDTDVTHQCMLHYSRDQHLIGIIEFSKPSFLLRWQDLGDFRLSYRRIFRDAFSGLCQCDDYRYSKM